MTLHTQFMTMGAMVLGGMYLGMVNETFRRLTPLWQGSAFLRYSLEILFWLGQTWLLYYLLYTINYGELRFYLFIALFFGFSIYMALLESIYTRILDLIIKFIKYLFNIFYKLCIFPIVFLIKMLVNIVFYILTFIYQSLRLLVFYVIILPLRWILPKKCMYFVSKIGSACSTMINTLYLKCRKLVNKIRR